MECFSRDALGLSSGAVLTKPNVFQVPMFKLFVNRLFVVSIEVGLLGQELFI